MQNLAKALFAALAIASVAYVQACGSGSSDGGGSEGASLAFQVRWPRGETSETPPFDSPIPSDVSRIRVIVRSQSSACCLKFDPSDGTFGDRRIVLTSLPSGPATVEVAGFPTDVAPNAGITDRCVVKDPEGAGAACDPTGCGQANYASSDVTSTELHKGEETVVTPLTEITRPFVLPGADPACDRTPSDPASLTLTVAQVDTRDPPDSCACVDGFLECGPDREQVELEDPELFQVRFDGPCSEAPPSAPRIAIDAFADSLCCSDGLNEDGTTCEETESCCRPENERSNGPPLVGYKVEIFDSELEAGCAEISVPVPGLPGARGPVVHAFVAITPRVTATPTPSATPTTSRTPTPVDTGPGDIVLGTIR